MEQDEDKPVFNADYIRELQAKTIKEREEEQQFIDTFGIDKQTFETMMSYIRRTIMNMATTSDTEVTICVTEAYNGTPYWANINFRERISDAIKDNYSKISTGFCSKLEELGFKVEAKTVNRAVPKRTDLLGTIEIKEIELKISW